MEDLYAAMPPFEMVKALCVRSVQCRDRVKTVRKIILIDVSKAHLYAPVDPGATAYVDLLPEGSKPGVCGKLQYWSYGMRPSSHGWQQEYTRRLAAMGFVGGEVSRTGSSRKLTMCPVLFMVMTSFSKGLPTC